MNHEDQVVEITAAFSGPRPHRFPFGENEDHPECIALKVALQKEIENLCQHGITRFLTGAANGVDAWCALIVLDLIKQGHPIVLIAIVPFKDQDEKWSTDQQARYKTVLSGCNEVITLSEHFYDGCYKVRNQYMIEHAKYLLAVQDHANRPNSGTRQTINANHELKQQGHRRQAHRDKGDQAIQGAHFGGGFDVGFLVDPVKKRFDRLSLCGDKG